MWARYLEWLWGAASDVFRRRDIHKLSRGRLYATRVPGRNIQRRRRRLVLLAQDQARLLVGRWRLHTEEAAEACEEEHEPDGADDVARRHLLRARPGVALAFGPCLLLRPHRRALGLDTDRKEGGHEEHGPRQR